MQDLLARDLNDLFIYLFSATTHNALCVGLVPTGTEEATVSYVYISVLHFREQQSELTHFDFAHPGKGRTDRNLGWGAGLSTFTSASGQGPLEA